MRNRIFAAFAVASLLALLGAGSARAQAVSVQINWPASTTSGIAGYTILRAPCTGTVTGTAQNGGITNGACSVVPAQSAFVALNSTPSAALNYTDSTVSPGVSYVYEVESVCTTGCGVGVTGSSAPSSEVAVTLPSVGPAPPTGLTLTVT
jgi:hypothetical protein